MLGCRKPFVGCRKKLSVFKCRYFITIKNYKKPASVTCLPFPSRDSNGENLINPNIWRYSVIVMFSCGAKKSNARVRRDQARGSPVPDFPVTPARASFNDTAVPNRPSSGTPAPWAPRLSVLARYSFISSFAKICLENRVLLLTVFRFPCVGFPRSTEVEKETTLILPNLFSSASFRKWFETSRTFCCTSEFLVRTI